jgi:hypothetical protein
VKRFELKLYGHEETRTVRFDTPGPVPLGCNIHDQMSAFIYVVDTPYAAKSGTNGTALIRDLPAGPARLTVWHPTLKARGNSVERTVAVAGQQLLVVPVDVKAAASSW